MLLYNGGKRNSFRVLGIQQGSFLVLLHPRIKVHGHFHEPWLNKAKAPHRAHSAAQPKYWPREGHFENRGWRRETMNIHSCLGSSCGRGSLLFH